MIIVVPQDEAHHRDVNYGYASKLGGDPDVRAKLTPYPEHANEIG